VLVAYLEFGRGRRRAGFLRRFPALHRFFEQRWYLDRFYRVFLDRVVYGIVARLCTANDRHVIDGGIDSLSRRIVRTGRLLSGWHTGMIQYRLVVVFIVLAMSALYFIF